MVPFIVRFYRWSHPIIFFLQILFLALSTGLFLYGFFLTKYETGFISDSNPNYDPHPPLYVFDSTTHPFRINPLDPSKPLSNLENENLLRKSKKSVIATHQDVIQSLQEWRNGMRIKSNCTSIFSEGDTLLGRGKELALFAFCRIIELSKTSKKTINIWGNGNENQMIQKILNSRTTNNDSIPTMETFLIQDSAIDKVIMIVIDALRFDFIKETLTATESDYYLNQMSFLNHLLKTEPDGSRLFQFIADAPTATVQRLKALVSGTLPTFLEVSESFSSAQVSEDTLLLQLWNNAHLFNNTNKNQTTTSSLVLKSVVMGDDTWDNLFGKYIDRSYPFPSFDIQDLDTVDDGILSTIWSELEKSDWTLLVAHFLGVDHVGHKHRVNHPEMARKLHQYDQFLKELVRILKKDPARYRSTMVIVCGDHGQTDDGSHGGALPQEIESALFVYTPHLQLTDLEVIRNEVLRNTVMLEDWDNLLNDYWSNTDDQLYRRIPQVDIVPTLAVLLGLPIPFPNLGSIIPEMIPILHQNATQQIKYLASLFLMNSFQMKRYALVYWQQTGKHIDDDEETELYWNSIVILYGELWDLYWNPSANHHSIDDDNQLHLTMKLLKACFQYQSRILNGARRRWTTFGTWSLTFAVIGTMIVVIYAAWVVSLYYHPLVSNHPISKLMSLVLRPEIFVIGILCGTMFSDCCSMLEATVVRFTIVSYIIYLNIIVVVRQEDCKTFFSVLSQIAFSRYTLMSVMLAAFVRLGPLFDISEALPGENSDPIIWSSLWCSRLLCCIWTVGMSIGIRFGFKSNRLRESQGKRIEGETLEIPRMRKGTKMRSSDGSEKSNFRKRKVDSLIHDRIGVDYVDFNSNRFSDWDNNILTSIILVSWFTLTVASILALGQENPSSIILSQFLPQFILIFSSFLFIGLNILFTINYQLFGSIPHLTLYLSLIGTLYFPTSLLWTFSQLVPTVLSLGSLLGSSLFAYFCHLDEIATSTLIVLSGFIGFYNLGHRMTFNAIPIAAGFLGLPGFHGTYSILLVFFHTFIVFIWAAILIPFIVSFLHPRTTNSYRSLHPSMTRSTTSLYFALSIVNFGFTLRMLASQIALIILRRHLVVWNVFAPKFLYDVQLSFLMLFSSFYVVLISTLAPLLKSRFFMNW